MACSRAPGEGDVRDNKPFVSYQRLVTATPAHTFTPSSVDELVTIVKLAESIPAPVRAVGSAWSQTPIMATDGHDGFLVRTERLNLTLSETLSGHKYGIADLLPPNGFSGAVDPVFVSLTESAKSRRLYHVEAGVKIIELYTRLECAERTRNVILREGGPNGSPVLHGWALPTMGGAGGQSLAGAISTSTHGGDFDRPPTPDMVHGIHLVAAGGAEFFIQRGGARAIVDFAKLQELVPCVAGCGQVVTDDDVFDAVVVSMGRMGIIYSMVLEVVPQYFLTETTKRNSWNKVKAIIAPDPGVAPSLGDDGTRFLEFNLLPYPDGNGDHECVVVSHVEAFPDGLGDSGFVCGRPQDPPQPPVVKGLFGYACHEPAPDFVRNLLIDVIKGLGLTAAELGALGVAAPVAVAIADLIIPGLGGVLVAVASWLGLTAAPAAPVASAASVTAATLLAPLLLPGATLGGYLAAILDVVARVGFVGRAGELVNAVLGSQLVHDNPTTDISFRIMDVHDYSGDDPANMQQFCYRGQSIEVAFDANEPAYIGYIDYVLDRISRHYESERLVYAGWISVRYCGRSSALLAIEQFDTTVLVEISALNGLSGSETMLDDFEQEGSKRGGILHWGQRNSRSASEIEARFPKINTWRSVLAYLSSHGLRRTFDNAFCQSHGLEVPEGIMEVTLNPCDSTLHAHPLRHLGRRRRRHCLHIQSGRGGRLGPRSFSPRWFTSRPFPVPPCCSTPKAYGRWWAQAVAVARQPKRPSGAFPGGRPQGVALPI